MRRGCRKSFTIYASPGSSFLHRISTSLGPFWAIFVSICPALINYNRASPPNGLRGAALVTFLKTRCGSGEEHPPHESELSQIDVVHQDLASVHRGSAAGTVVRVVGVPVVGSLGVNQ